MRPNLSLATAPPTKWEKIIKEEGLQGHFEFDHIIDIAAFPLAFPDMTVCLGGSTISKQYSWVKTFKHQIFLYYITASFDAKSRTYPQLYILNFSFDFKSIFVQGLFNRFQHIFHLFSGNILNCPFLTLWDDLPMGYFLEMYTIHWTGAWPFLCGTDGRTTNNGVPRGSDLKTRLESHIFYKWLLSEFWFSSCSNIRETLIQTLSIIYRLQFLIFPGYEDDIVCTGF